MNMLRPAAFAAVTLGATAEAQAAPTLYDINFTNTVGSLTPSGSFMYDSTTKTFANFIVDFDDTPLNFTAAATAPSSDRACSGPVTGFAIMSGTTNCPSNQVWAFIGDSSFNLLFANFLCQHHPFQTRHPEYGFVREHRNHVGRYPTIPG